MLWIRRKEWKKCLDKNKGNPFESFLNDYNKRKDKQFVEQSITALIILDDADRGCSKKQNNENLQQNQNVTNFVFLHSAPIDDIR